LDCACMGFFMARENRRYEPCCNPPILRTIASVSRS
jgi:hypothetical protein